MCFQSTIQKLLSFLAAPSRQAREKQRTEKATADLAAVRLQIQEEQTKAAAAIDDERVLEAARQVYDEAVQKWRQPQLPEQSVDAQLAEARLVHGLFKAARETAARDVQDYLNAHGSIDLAELKICDVRQNFSPATTVDVERTLEQARQKLEACLYEESYTLGRSAYEKACDIYHNLTWQQVVEDLCFWRTGARVVPVELAQLKIPTDAIALQGSAILEAAEKEGWSPTLTWLVLAWQQELTAHNTILGRCHYHQLLHRTPDYDYVAKLAEMQVEFSRTHFGPDSVEVVAALCRLSTACQRNGMLHGPASLAPVASEMPKNTGWEMQQYAHAKDAAGQALGIVDRLLGLTDPRSQRTVVRLVTVPRHRDDPLPTEIKQRFDLAVHGGQA